MTTTGVVFPLMTVRCWSVTRFSFFIQSGSLKFKICTLPPPSSVTLLPPSMTVLVLMGRFMVLVTGIVTGAAPQLNVMMPPFFTAALSASKVQVPAVPVPITAVGFDTSAGCAPAGSEAVQWVGIVDPLAPPVPSARPCRSAPKRGPRGRAGLLHAAAGQGRGGNRLGEGYSLRIQFGGGHRLHGPAGGRGAIGLCALPDRRHRARALSQFDRAGRAD